MPVALVLVLSICSPVFAQSDHAAIDRFFQSFTEDRMRLDPQSATGSNLFPPAEQLRLDGRLSDVMPENTAAPLLDRRYILNQGITGAHHRLLAALNGHQIRSKEDGDSTYHGCVGSRL
jgi:hypothetical protein